MTQLVWYVRRAVPWLALLACCGAAAVAALALHQWPASAGVLVPAILGSCAAGAAFVFDERELAITAVTPRAAWRRTARLAVAVVPLTVWSGVVLSRPDTVPLDRPGWWLIGAALTLLTVGAAALAGRREQEAPGSGIASVVAVAVFVPGLLSMLLDWGSLYPVGEFGSGVRVFWGAVALAGLATCVVALRPGLGRTRAARLS